MDTEPEATGLKGADMTIPKAKLRRAINTHCKNCIYDRAEPGTWRMQVKNCTVTTCALHPYRPKPIRSVFSNPVGKNKV